jgi:DNA anti-recombination protein RmuC
LLFFLIFIKKIDDVKDRLSKIESKLDISDERYHNTNETIKSNNQTITQRVDRLEIDFKELMNKFLDFLPKPIL